MRGPYDITISVAAALLLLTSGLLKLKSAEPVRDALRTSGLPSERWVGFSIASVEIVTGLALLVVGTRTVQWFAVSLFAMFFFFLLSIKVRGLPLASCGCFGRDDTPLSSIHLVTTAFITALLAISATSTTATGWTLRSTGFTPGLWVPPVLLGCSLFLLLYAALDPLPRVVASLAAPGRTSAQSDSHGG
jgi:hypothetical protein